MASVDGAKRLEGKEKAILRAAESPAPARDAASVILLRDVPAGGIEVLMVRRHARSDFAADMHVFPGGAVEECDCGKGVAELCSGYSPEEAFAVVGDAASPAEALGLFVAGIRETFEEAGILLARWPSGELVSHRDEGAARFASLRQALAAERMTFMDMIAGEGLKLAVDRLVYFAHWITPELSPVRYDTRFFLAAAPPLQDALHDSVEVTAHLWVSPQRALEMNRSGAFAMLPPTVVNLMALTRFSSVREALAAASGRDVPVVAPRVILEGGKARLVLPEDHGVP